MRIETDIKLDFKDVLIKPKRSTLNSRNEVNLSRTYVFRNSKQTWTGIPIMSSNMDTTGTLETANVLMKHKLFTCLHKFYNFGDEEILNKIIKLDFNYVALSSGICDDELELSINNVKKYGFKFICLDVANGYTERFVNAVKLTREKLPDVTIIAGNVVTAEMTEELILAGADIIKIGIGPGSVCLTRKQTGVGYPQLSAIIECADAAHGLGGHIVSDGGCVVAGDLAKGFGAGADFIMLGGMLAGHDESGGEIIETNGKKYKEFYGMSSEHAMNKYVGEMAKYRSSEGKLVRI